jgi:hypothetical protein
VGCSGHVCGRDVSLLAPSLARVTVVDVLTVTVQLYDISPHPQGVGNRYSKKDAP